MVSQYLSGTQTRRIGALVDQYPEPQLEIHPRLAEQHGIADGDWVTVTTRRDDDHAAGAWWCAPSGPTRCSFRITGPARRSANRLTHRTLDPRSKIPEFKVSACRIAGQGPESATARTDRKEAPNVRHTSSMSIPRAASAASPA